MFETLASLNERPAPFSVYTTDLLWTDDYVSARMLEHHLNPDEGLASRRFAAIDGTVGWLDRRLGLDGMAVCDLGCGPGLYAERMARRGARVTGLDFSARSVDYARTAAAAQGLPISYGLADYLKDDLPGDQDLVFLIFCDLCVLSPEQRRRLYAKIRKSLTPGGHFVFDVPSLPQFEQRVEGTRYGRWPANGFWAPGPYFEFVTTFLYDDLQLALDRYLIVEKHRRREILNWLQHFSPESISAELAANGFATEAVVDVSTGQDWQYGQTEFAVVARPRPVSHSR